MAMIRWYQELAGGLAFESELLLYGVIMLEPLRKTTLKKARKSILFMYYYDSKERSSLFVRSFVCDTALSK